MHYKKKCCKKYKKAGKYLPHHFTVTYFDAKTGTLKRTESFSDTHTKISDIWFPTQRRVIRADNGVITARVVEIRNSQVKTGN